MCGIVGYFDRGLTFSRPETLKAMTDSIRHRGPNDEGCFVMPGVGLGSRRLSILDTSSRGHMPMTDPATGNVIVFNGEIYNYREIVQSLNLGSGLTSGTDTEVALKAYSQLGPRCLDLFNGIFAFAIWDPKNKRLFCARDRIGVKPFYYTQQGGITYFASEIKAFQKCGISLKPDLKTFHQYLTLGIYDHGEATFFEGIKQLPPAAMMLLEPGRSDISRYWHLEPKDEAPFHSDLRSVDRSAEKFLELFNDSVRLQLRSDVPIAVHVSGGFDSTLLLATLNEVNGGQGKLKAFSHIYGDDRYDETKYVKALTDKLNWEVDYYQLKPGDVPKLAEQGMWFQEQPFPGVITLAKHHLIQSSEDFGAKVILEGQGGDEICAGYQYMFGTHLLDLIAEGKSKEAHTEMELFGEVNGWEAHQTLAKTLNGLSSYYELGRSADGTPSVNSACLDPDFARTFATELRFPKPFRSHLLNMQYRDLLHTKLPRILRSCDRASMAYGKELRVPLLDHRLVEFCFSIPGSHKVQQGIQRYFLRKGFKQRFDHVLADLPKRAVVDPQREWLKTHLRPFAEELLWSDSFSNRGIFDVEKVRAEYQRYCSEPTSTNSFPIWQWISVELWFRTFVD